MQIGKSPDSILSRGIEVRIPEEIDVVASWSLYRGFLFLESRCRGLSSSEKTAWNLDGVAFLSPFLEVVVYVLPRPHFRYHLENKRITHNYFNYVVEKYFNCPNLCNIYLHNV